MLPKYGHYFHEVKFQSGLLKFQQKIIYSPFHEKFYCPPSLYSAMVHRAFWHLIQAFGNLDKPLTSKFMEINRAFGKLDKQRKRFCLTNKKEHFSWNRSSPVNSKKKQKYIYMWLDGKFDSSFSKEYCFLINGINKKCC